MSIVFSFSVALCGVSDAQELDLLQLSERFTAHVLGIRSHELLEFALGAQPESHPAALIAPRHQPHVEQNPVIVVFALRALVLPCDVSDAQELELLPLSERFARIEHIAIPCSLALKKRVTLWRRRLSRVGLLHRLRSRSPSDHS